MLFSLEKVLCVYRSSSIKVKRMFKTHVLVLALSATSLFAGFVGFAGLFLRGYAALLGG